MGHGIEASPAPEISMARQTLPGYLSGIDWQTKRILQKSLGMQQAYCSGGVTLLAFLDL
jgi:hypothetical protein